MAKNPLIIPGRKYTVRIAFSRKFIWPDDYYLALQFSQVFATRGPAEIPVGTNLICLMVQGEHALMAITNCPDDESLEREWFPISLSKAESHLVEGFEAE